VLKASVNLSYSKSSLEQASLSVPSLGRYMKVEVSNELASAISSVIYWYNTTDKAWVKLNTSMGWVYGTGVNTSGDYVWANVSH
jgi:hypothetical protein